MKTIIPRKVVIDLNDDGTFKNGVLVYQLCIDNSIDAQKFYTMEINGGINIEELQKTIDAGKAHVERGEKIT